MSKLAILKELADIKVLAQRKSALKRGALIAALAYVLVSYGGGAWSYVTTASRIVTNKVRSNVPLEFELERARTMITGLIPDVRESMLVIAQEEVGVEDLRKQIGRGESGLAAQREELVAMRAKLTGGAEPVSLGARTATKDELRSSLARSFSRYQLAEATLASRRQLLTAREEALEAARSKLASMLNARRDLEVQVENLQAQLKTQQSRTVSSSLDVNDSEVTRCQGLLNEIRARMEVADRLFASEGDLTFMTSTMAPPADDIGEQIDRYFAPASTDAVASNVR
jgi:chromosome segregation ATPase